MSQSRLHSAYETAANIAVGYSIGFVSNAFIMPLFGYHISTKDNISLGVIYTIISIVRSYTLRRVFNSFKGKSAWT